MASLPMSKIQHFTHPKHSLTLLFDSNTKYLCDGCKIPGIGKRYHCHECNFDLHEYCGTCPMNLSSFLHPHHSLKLVGERQLDHFCNVCLDSPEGLFYRCEACDFDVHPLCTQLPQTLRHVLHQVHPLRLLGLADPGTCAVCRGACNAYSWRYRCPLCGFDIHIGCVPIQCEKKVTTDRGIPTYVPPSRFSSYACEIPTYVPPSTFPQQHYFGGYNPSPNHFPGPSNMHQHYFGGYNPSPNHFPDPSNMHHYNYNMPQLHQQHQGHGHAQTHYNSNNPYFPSSHYMHNNHMSQPQHQHHGQAQTHYGGGRIGQVMFNLVQTLAMGAFSNMIFGMDLSSG